VVLSVDDIASLYRHNARGMLSFFARRTYDPDVAMDLVAETFAAAIADRAQFRGATLEEARAWLFGIARHKLSAWYRRGDVERRAVERLAVERRRLTEAEQERIGELADLDGRRPKVREHLDELPVRVREAIELRVVGERSYREVAEALHISEEAARARVSRGLRDLARCRTTTSSKRGSSHE
jgi:RNA polymerase sigma-70 factor (ECF subfamily)